MRALFRVIIVVMMMMTGLSGCERQENRPKQVKIGIVNLTPTLDGMIPAFKEKLAELGYIENETVVYIYDGAAGAMDCIDFRIDRIVEEKVDLVFSITTPVTLRVKKALEDRGTPIVFAPIIDPLKAGLVHNLREPGGRLTGVMASGSASKGLEWLLKIIPDLKRIYVPFNSEDKAMSYSMAALQQVADARNIELVIAEAVTNDEVVSALKNIPQDVEAVWELPSGFWAPYLDLFVKFPIEHKKPLMGSGVAWVEMGSLIAVGESIEAMGKQAGRLAYKILQGTLPSSLPVERADMFLFINLKTAESIGLEIPKTVLKQADIIIR